MKEHVGVRVIVSGSFPDRMNSNLILRHFLAEGIRECIGVDAVLDISLDSLAMAIQMHNPQLVLCFGSCPPEVTNFSPLRAACDDAGSHLAFWLHDDPYEFDLNYSAVDVADTLITNDSWSALHYNHPRVFHLPLAASLEAHYREWIEEKETDVFFCGVAFSNRIALLRDLASILSSARTTIFGDGWPTDLPGSINQRITNSDVSNRCARTRATLYMGRNLHFSNHHYQLDPSTPGPRFFEAAMSGTVQLVFADTLEVLEYFDTEEGILIYDDPRGFKFHLDHLRDDPKFGKTVAQRGQTRAIRDHTYTARARTLLGMCGLDHVSETLIRS